MIDSGSSIGSIEERPYFFIQCSIEVNDEVTEVPNDAEAKSAD